MAKIKKCKVCLKIIESGYRCPECRKVHDLNRKRKTYHKNKYNAKPPKYVGGPKWSRNFPIVEWAEEKYLALKLPEKLNIRRWLKRLPLAGIDPKFDLELSDDEKKIMTFLELLLTNKGYELIKAGKLRDFEQIKTLFSSASNVENLFAYYDLLEKIEKEEEEENIDINIIKPYLGQGEILPEQMIYIARCCATCKHYRSIHITQNNTGFCKFGRVDPKLKLLGSSFKKRFSKEKIKEIVEQLKKIYPLVHPWMDCDNYEKTTKRIRLRRLFEFIKNIQEQIIYRTDVK